MLQVNLHLLWPLKNLMTALHLMEARYSTCACRTGQVIFAACCLLLLVRVWIPANPKILQAFFLQLHKLCLHNCNNLFCIYLFVTYFLILNKKESFTTSRINVMLERSWSKICIYHMAWLQDNLKTQWFLNRDLWQVLLCHYIQLPL